jgi:hypothetical protein
MNDVSADSPSIAVVLNRDLLFGSRIRSALGHCGLEGRFVPTADAFVQALTELGDAAAIGIVDMNGAVDWEAIRVLLQRPSLVPTLAFGPHTDVADRRAAKTAGIARIVSNGQFQAEMATLIERYRRT